MATIWKAGDALERCSVCGLQRQFHDRASEPHELVPETLADYEPGDLSPAQLVSEIFDKPHSPRAVACGEELRARVKSVLGVDHEDLTEASGMSDQYPTVVWVGRIRGLQSHLRVIAQSCADSENPHVQRIGRQAISGIAEADRYLADPDWSTDPHKQEAAQC